MGKFVVVVLDSFGVGAMEDVPEVRPEDTGANTCKHILENMPHLYLPTLERLGLMNALGEEVNRMRVSADAVYGTSDLMHYGGDTFYGHQEMMGTRPIKPLRQPFNEVIDDVYRSLVQKGYKVRYLGEGPYILLVNECITVGDNLETDPGQVYNVTGTFEKATFEEIKAVGRAVREVVQVSRVIAFGGEGVSVQQILGAKKNVEGIYCGIDTPSSGVYEKGYLVVHLGYGINPEVQIPTLLNQKNIPVILIGKVADIVENPQGRLIPGVDTAWLFEQTIRIIQDTPHGFICLNIQETDLAGHAENVERYAEKLQTADEYLAQMLPLFEEEDILIVMADHGNDPTIGHSHHTRERVPIMVYKKGLKGRYLGHFQTMSDVGATAAEYFSVSAPENGSSFLGLLR